MKKQYLHIVQHANLFLLAAMLLCSGSIKAQYVKRYNQLSIYVIAHQDDWQLFMGSNVYNDIQAFDEITPDINGKKVVIIYTTAGNLNEDDDTKSCNCRDPFDTKNLPFPYWKVREVGSKRSLHLAATRKGGWGAVYPYPENKTVNIGGHDITRYEYKNTVSYYLRLKAGAYSNWYHTPNARVETVDGSATYADWADFVNTLYYIFKTEKDSSVLNNQVCIGYQDVNETTNPNDHHDHYIAGRASSEAAKLLGKELDTCLSQTLFVDYNSQNLPLNLVSPDIQNEAALTSVYCLALLDYNAWPEWGSIYQDWTSRNYSRTITCENPTSNDLLAKDSLLNMVVKLYPSPADRNLYLRFNLPLKSNLLIKIADSKGSIVYNYNGPLTSSTFQINTTKFASGYYLATVSSDNVILTKTMFEVIH